jgi:hypothetical protein
MGRAQVSTMAVGAQAAGRVVAARMPARLAGALLTVALAGFGPPALAKTTTVGNGTAASCTGYRSDGTEIVSTACGGIVP